MKKISLVPALCLCVILPAAAPGPFSLEELARPAMLLVDHDRIFVLDGATVYIYSLKDHRLIRQFGKAGEGPGEFRYNPAGGRPLSMLIHDGRIIVNSEYRMSYFDLDGGFIKEEKVPVDRLLFPVDGKFLGIGMLPGEDNRPFIGYTLHDRRFESEKTIFISDVEIQTPRKLTLPLTSFTYDPTCADKFFISVSSDEFIINVYDINGRLDYTIKKDYPRLPIPSDFKSEALEFFKNHPGFARSYEFIKNILHVRDYFPPIRDLQILEDHIYVLTFKRKNGLWELIKMDLKGHEQGRTFIPLSTYEHFTFYPILYSIYEGKVYTLVEEIDEEIWQVHVTRF